MDSSEFMNAVNEGLETKGKTQEKINRLEKYSLLTNQQDKEGIL